jgi:large subunit ribosomal protein L12
MEYVYAALLLHAAGKEIKEDSVTKVLEAAGAKPDSARVKALVASLKDVNIEEAIKNASAMQAAPAAAPAAGEAKSDAKEEKKEEEGKSEEEAAEGLAGLFG